MEVDVVPKAIVVDDDDDDFFSFMFFSTTASTLGPLTSTQKSTNANNSQTEQSASTLGLSFQTEPYSFIQNSNANPIRTGPIHSTQKNLSANSLQRVRSEDRYKAIDLDSDLNSSPITCRGKKKYVKT